MKNLFNILKLIITNPKGRKQLECKKNTFCNCSQDLSDMCITCLETNKIKPHMCIHKVIDPEKPVVVNFSTLHINTHAGTVYSDSAIVGWTFGSNINTYENVKVVTGDNLLSSLPHETPTIPTSPTTVFEWYYYDDQFTLPVKITDIVLSWATTIHINRTKKE